MMRLWWARTASCFSAASCASLSASARLRATVLDGSRSMPNAGDAATVCGRPVVGAGDVGPVGADGLAVSFGSLVPPVAGVWLSVSEGAVGSSAGASVAGSPSVPSTGSGVVSPDVSPDVSFDGSVVTGPAGSAVPAVSSGVPVSSAAGAGAPV